MDGNATCAISALTRVSPLADNSSCNVLIPFLPAVLRVPSDRFLRHLRFEFGAVSFPLLCHEPLLTTFSIQLFYLMALSSFWGILNISIWSPCIYFCKRILSN